MKHRKIRKISFSIIFAYFVLSGSLFNNVWAAKAPDQSMEGFSLSNFGKDNKKEWDLSGNTLEVFGNLIEMTNVTAKVYGNDAIVLTSDTGSFNRNEGEVRLKDNVLIVSDSGMKMMSDTLNWMQNKDLVYTDDKVHIVRDNMVVQGLGAQGHPNLKQLNLKKDVTVDIEEQKDTEGGLRKITIVCDGPLDIDYLQQIAIFNNNVQAHDGESELYADKMTGHFDNETKQLTEIIAEGNVKIVRGQDIAYGQKAVYNSITQKISLIGRPRLVIYSMENKNTEGQNAAP